MKQKVINELSLFDISELKKIIGELKKEQKALTKGARRSFYLSKFLNKTNYEFVVALNENFYKQKNKILAEAELFRNDEKNIEKYNLNHRKEKLQNWPEYMELAYPSISDDKWDIECEIDMVLSAMKTS
jgi:vacuolar-type H+-ATPase subunit H